MRKAAVILTLALPNLAAGAGEKMEHKGPLAGLPSRPGPHIERIKALGDNEWLELGAPAADPKWGRGRGASWGARMPYAPDLQAAFLYGQGAHLFKKPDGRYMDDLFLYDVNGHRWICLYPGSDVKNTTLKMDENGFEVDQDGQPVPLVMIGHGWEQITYDTHRRRFMFMPCPNSDAGLVEATERRKAWGGYKYPGWPPYASPFMYSVDVGKWELLKTEAYPRTSNAIVLVYVPSLRKAFLWNVEPQGRVWLYNPEANTWTRLSPKGPPPPFGIDASACLDTKRERIYIGGGYYPHSKGPHAFWCYDLRSDAWLDLHPKGKPCKGCNRYGPNHALLNYDTANDVVVLTFHRWQMNVPVDAEVSPGPESRGIYIYDPAANAWNEAPLDLPRRISTDPARPGIPMCPRGFYSPDLNAHFVYTAGDSDDRGTMWVYRYKRAEAK